MIAIVDVGLGNVKSIKNMLQKGGVEALLASDAKTLEAAEKIILPGVGAFDSGMRLLNESGLRGVLDRKAEEKTPLLGICLGMQLLGAGSEEGKAPGLGYIPMHCKKFDRDAIGLPVPHMGWNKAVPAQEHPLFADMPERARFYFVHSYYAVCDDETNVLSMSDYGVKFASAVVKEHIMGVQFHPEKSHKFGMQLLQNFARI
jgi:glutamine amidotransferase